jgi:hypothetical protein
MWIGMKAKPDRHDSNADHDEANAAYEFTCFLQALSLRVKACNNWPVFSVHWRLVGAPV